MSYRDDLDALTSRQAALQAELGRKQRELAQLTGLIAEARQVEQAESYFDRAPDLRRRRRFHVIAGALVVLLVSGVALGAASAAEETSHPETAGLVQGAIARLQANRARHEQLVRLYAELEALRTLHLIPVVAPATPAVRGLDLSQHSPPLPAWVLGSSVPVRGSLWTGSLARKDDR